MNRRVCLLCGGLLGAVGVAAGALGAHALETRLTPERMETYQVAVRYQLFHAVALVLTGVLLAQNPSKAGRIAAWAFLLGILLFSGCLYGWLASQWRPLVHVVPIGGIALIAGWISLAIAGWSSTAR